MMPSAKMPMREIAPPVNMFRMPPMPVAACIHELPQRQTVDAGNRDVGAKPVDDQKAKSEQDALAQFGGLAERPPAHVCGHLFCCGCHAGFSLLQERRQTVSRSAAP